MLKNAYFLAKIGADTAENEQHFAEIVPIGRRVADRCDTVAGCSEGRLLALSDVVRGVRHALVRVHEGLDLRKWSIGQVGHPAVAM